MTRACDYNSNSNIFGEKWTKQIDRQMNRQKNEIYIYPLIYFICRGYKKKGDAIGSVIQDLV